MSTQYGTISHRRSVDVPVWLIAVALMAILVLAGVTVGRGLQGSTRPETLTVPRTVYTNSRANIREAGAFFPATTTGGQISGGPSHLAPGNRAQAGAPTTSGVWVGDYFCHQCR